MSHNPFNVSVDSTGKTNHKVSVKSTLAGYATLYSAFPSLIRSPLSSLGRQAGLAPGLGFLGHVKAFVEGFNFQLWSLLPQNRLHQTI